MARLLFWACSGFLLYVYVLYPLAVRTLGVLLGTPATVSDDRPHEPSIRSLDVLIRERHLLNPLKYGSLAWRLWWQVLLYASPILWFGAFVANAALARDSRDPLYLILLVGQTTLLVAGAVGFMLQHEQRELGAFDKAYRIIRTNLASLIATLRYLAERTIEWVLVFWIIVVLIAYLALRYLTAAPDAATSHQRSHHHVSPPAAAAPERPDER